MAAIQADEIAGILTAAARGGLMPTRIEATWSGDVVLAVAGYTFVFFIDAGDLDYLDSAASPDGRSADFDEWFEDKVDVLHTLPEDVFLWLANKLEGDD